MSEKISGYVYGVIIIIFFTLTAISFLYISMLIFSIYPKQLSILLDFELVKLTDEGNNDLSGYIETQEKIQELTTTISKKMQDIKESENRIQEVLPALESAQNANLVLSNECDFYLNRLETIKKIYENDSIGEIDFRIYQKILFSNYIIAFLADIIPVVESPENDTTTTS